MPPTASGTPFANSISEAVATVTPIATDFMLSTIYIPIRLIAAYWQFILIAALIVAGLALARKFGIIRF